MTEASEKTECQEQAGATGTSGVNERQSQALQIVKANVGWATGAGFVPVPFLDLAAILAVQLRMVKCLSDHYGVPFQKGAVKSIIGAIVGSGSAYLVSGPVASMVKAVPVVGFFASTFVEPAAAAGSTYALGKVFIQHFESGGTLLDLDPAAVRQHYYEEYQKGREASPAA
jgi:uncharacterized protein (DUF697 family)